MHNWTETAIVRCMYIPKWWNSRFKEIGWNQKWKRRNQNLNVGYCLSKDKTELKIRKISNHRSLVLLFNFFHFCPLPAVSFIFKKKKTKVLLNIPTNLCIDAWIFGHRNVNKIKIDYDVSIDCTFLRFLGNWRLERGDDTATER